MAVLRGSKFYVNSLLKASYIGATATASLYIAHIVKDTLSNMLKVLRKGGKY